MTHTSEDRDEPDREEPEGIACPTCGCRHLYVLYTRRLARRIMRRRECRHCGRRITTYEKP